MKATPPRTLMLGGLAALAVVVLALSVVAAVMLSGENSTNLDDDPRGQEACDALIQSIRYDGDTEVQVGSLLEAGKAASKARTDSIRDAASPLADGVEELEDFSLVDVEALTKACENAGVEIPER